MPRIIRWRQTRENPSVPSSCDYWHVTVTIPLFDSILSEPEIRFSDNKLAHFELCALIPEVIREKDVQETCDILRSKWKHLPAEDILESELARWNVHCFGISGEKSITRYYVRILTQSFFQIFVSFFVSWLCFQLAVLKPKGRFPVSGR